MTDQRRHHRSRRRTFSFTGLVLASVILPGCETHQRADESTQHDEEEQLHQVAEERPAEVVKPELSELQRRDFRELTAAESSRRIAAKPSIANPLVKREIKLYEALYHAAYTTNVGLITQHYLLDLPDDPPDEWYPDGVALEESELLLHVMARLDRLNVPMRWMPPNSTRSLSEPIRFPGTPHLATRFGVRLLERTESDERGRPSVRARLTDATAHVGGTRQDITATWDGETWQIQRDRIFQVW